MKKILMGLVALSTISFTAPVEPSAPAKNDTAVFETGMQGKIALKGKMTTTVNPVKYVVFASTGDGSTVGEDIADLGNFIITTGATATGTSGFEGTTPTVYVKRVGADGGLLPLKAQDTFEFSIFVPKINAQTRWYSVGKREFLTPFDVLTSSQLDEVYALGTDLSLSPQGYLQNKSSNFYINTYDIGFKMEQEGVITIFNHVPGWTTELSLPEETVKAVSDYFAKGIDLQTQNVAIYVRSK